MRLLSTFKAAEARDELGIGGIRDSIADQLFPGTSTIQTRLRYFFFIPWLFSQLEERKIAASGFASSARQAEFQLLNELLNNVPESEWGIIGRQSKSALKRLPSSVYWAGLGSWGLRVYNGAQQQYFDQVDQIYAVRSAKRRRDDTDDHDGDASGQVWHPKLIKLRPEGFPNNARLPITRDEAEFLLDRWRNSHPESLFSWLALDMVKNPAMNDVDRVWLHPRFADFPKEAQILIQHAQRFDVLIQGAALMYNLLLAQLSFRQELIDDYDVRLEEWVSQESSIFANWNLDEFWPLVLGKGHSVTDRTRQFVREWQRLVTNRSGKMIDAGDARQLIERRERELKESSGKSRFTNRTALNQWGGGAGLVPLDYRWLIARNFLTEWHQGWVQK